MKPFVFATFGAVSMAVAEIGIIMFVSTLLEGSLREASHFGITGREETEIARIDSIRTIINRSMIGLVDADAAVITVETYPSFADIEKGETLMR